MGTAYWNENAETQSRDELESGLHSQTYTLDNILRRMGQKTDPWADIQDEACALHAPRVRLDTLQSEAN